MDRKVIILAILAILIGICLKGYALPQQDYHTCRIAPDHPDIRYTGVVHTSITETTAELLRFTPAFLESPSYGKWNKAKARTQSGVTISFKTRSPYIIVHFSKLEDSEIRKRNFAVFKNGKFQRDKIQTLTFEITNTEEDEAVWTITLPVFSGVKFNGLELVDGYSLSTLEEDNRPVYVALGNSITHGVGQNEGSHLTYPFLLAEKLGYQLYNLGIGGSKVNTQVVQNLEHLQPELITVLWGYNDINAPTPLADMLVEYDALLTLLIRKFPQANICVVLQTYTTTTKGKQNPSNTTEGLRNGQKQIVERLATNHSRLFLFDGWVPTYGADNLVDAVHLNKTGASKLARALFEYLKTK